MTKLSALQNKFIDGVYDGSKLDVLKSIKDGKAPKEELFDIYRNNLYATLTDSLRITYPKIYQFTGEKKFKNLCKEFIKQNRSYSGNLDDYGVNFADFFAEKLFDVKFKLHPSCFLIDSGYNLLSKKKQSKPQKKQNYFVIYRHDIEVKAERISKGEFNFLSGVKENLSLYQIYEKYKINIQTCLQKYLANSVLSSFSV